MPPQIGTRSFQKSILMLARLERPVAAARRELEAAQAAARAVPDDCRHCSRHSQKLILVGPAMQ
jgi:hypothetical protein